jgi:hypothetical protein
MSCLFRLVLRILKCSYPWENVSLFKARCETCRFSLLKVKYRNLRNGPNLLKHRSEKKNYYQNICNGLISEFNITVWHLGSVWHNAVYIDPIGVFCGLVYRTVQSTSHCCCGPCRFHYRSQVTELSERNVYHVVCGDKITFYWHVQTSFRTPSGRPRKPLPIHPTDSAQPALALSLSSQLSHVIFMGVCIVAVTPICVIFVHLSMYASAAVLGPFAFNFWLESCMKTFLDNPPLHWIRAEIWGTLYQVLNTFQCKRRR